MKDAVAEVHRNRGTHFDPALVDVFDSVLPELLKTKAKFRPQTTIWPPKSNETVRESPKRSRTRSRVA